MNTLCCGQCHSTFPPLESVCAPEVDIAIKSQTFCNKHKENNCEAPMTSRTKPSVVQSPVSANPLFSFVWKSVRKPASAGIGTLKLKALSFSISIRAPPIGTTSIRASIWLTNIGVVGGVGRVVTIMGVVLWVRGVVGVVLWVAVVVAVVVVVVLQIQRGD